MGDATITAADGIVADGTIYQFKVNAQNQFGVSDLSDFVLAAMSDFPDKPSPPTKISGDETSITLGWAASMDKELQVIGYQLLIDDGNGGDFKVI